MPDPTDKPHATAAGVIGGILLVLAADALFFYAGLGKHFAYTSIFVGIWQWLYVIPLWIYSRRSAHRGLRIGILVAAWIVLAVNLGAFTYLYFMLHGSHFLQ